jgi:hypothetical protein
MNHRHAKISAFISRPVRKRLNCNNTVAHGFAFVNILVITYSLEQIHIYLEAVGIVGLQLSILSTLPR